MVSVTVTIPEVALPPVLATDNVKLFPAEPCANVPLAVLVIANIASDVVFTVTILLVAPTLPPPLTVAVLDS